MCSALAAEDTHVASWQEDVRVWTGQWLQDALEFAVRHDGGGEVTAAMGQEPMEVTPPGMCPTTACLPHLASWEKSRVSAAL
jgi:hypothetical protein